MELEAEELQGKIFLLGPSGDAEMGCMGRKKACAERNKRVSQVGRFLIARWKEEEICSRICPGCYALSFYKHPAVED